MAAIKSTREIAQKFIKVTPERTQEYADGVAKPKKDWAQSTEAAESSYEDGVKKAMEKKKFGKGIRNAGNEKYQDGVRKKGATRWGPGVSLSEDAYAKGFAPFRDTIESVQLPQRYAKRDPRNMKRVEAVVLALSRKKDEMN